MSVRVNNNKSEVAGVLIECSTDEVIIGWFDSDPYYEKFKTMIL